MVRSNTAVPCVFVAFYVINGCRIPFMFNYPTFYQHDVEVIKFFDILSYLKNIEIHK